MKSLLYYCYAMCITTITYIWNFIMQVTTLDAIVETITVLAPIIGIAISGYVSYKLAVLHKQVNSRMDQLLAAKKEEGKAEIILEDRADAKAEKVELKVQLDKQEDKVNIQIAKEHKEASEEQKEAAIIQKEAAKDQKDAVERKDKK